MNVLVTGAHGFLGKHLCLSLESLGHTVLKFGRNDIDLDFKIVKADAIFHLASVMRSDDPKVIFNTNLDLTQEIIDILIKYKKKIPIVFTSSIQAIHHTSYGTSKLESEKRLIQLNQINQNPIKIFRLKWIFGKWSKPYGHSVVSTFISQVIAGSQLTIHDPNSQIELIYVDDVIKEMIEALFNKSDEIYFETSISKKISLRELSDLLIYFKTCESKLFIPNLNDDFVKKMYSTYISFKEVNSLSSTLNTIIDSRGSFTELIKSKSFGQLSLNITSPGIEKGNHYHNHKHEKFTVVSGSGEIKMRKLFDNQIIIIKVSDRKIQSIDIPPGYVHSIRNTGSTDLITIIWANEEFDQKYPDTYQTEV